LIVLDIFFRNVKPENFLFTSDSNDADIKLVHFTHAIELAKGPLTQACGSSGYCSPEMIRRERYGKPVDMWSFGVVLFNILSGTPPFFHEDTPTLLQMILDDEVSFNPDYWSEVSKEAKDLILKLLEKDPTKRLTAKDSLKHKWFSLADESLKGSRLTTTADFASKRSFFKNVNDMEIEK
jgi:serine/threonine protein kinase